MTIENQYCDLKNFYKSFKHYHVYFSVFVCTLGTVFNILNVCVLTKKPMRCPTNFILTSLAVADILVMVEYIPFAYLQDSDSQYYSYYYTYSFAAFIIFHAIYTQSLHFISCCITIVLAIWRYIAVKFPQNVQWYGDTRTKWTIFLTYLLCPFICLPLYLSTCVSEKDAIVDETGKFIKNETNVSVYVKKFSVQYTDSAVLKIMSLYIYGIVIKLLPCIFLTVLSCLLIVELLKAKDRRKKLLYSQPNEDGSKKKVNQRHLEKEKQADRTTKMLLAVLLLFLMVEFPQAVFGLLNHIIGIKFESECYYPLGDLLDLFALTNSAINFLLYCSMSQKFREVFREIFCPLFPNSRKDQWISLQTVNTVV